jgi:hypothetical protein
MLTNSARYSELSDIAALVAEVQTGSYTATDLQLDTSNRLW